MSKKKIGIIVGVLVGVLAVVLVACNRSNSAVFELQEGEAEALGVVFPEDGKLTVLYDEYMEKKEYDKAIVVAKKMAELSFGGEGEYLGLESAYKKAGRYEDALIVINKVLGSIPSGLKLEETEIGYILERIDLLKKIGRQEEADRENEELTKRYNESREQ